MRPRGRCGGASAPLAPAGFLAVDKRGRAGKLCRFTEPRHCQAGLFPRRPGERGAVSSPVTQFKVDRISEAPASRTLLADREWIEGLALGIAGEIEAPLAFALEMYRLGDDVFVSGRVEGSTSLPCYRCLKRVAEPFAGSFRVVYLPMPENPRAGSEGGRERAEPGKSEPADIEGDNEDVFHHLKGSLDLLPMLREQLLVALPERALCKEGCEGLCPTCGADLNGGMCDCPAQSGFSKFGKLRNLRIR